jgi:hypothetical protein
MIDHTCCAARSIGLSSYLHVRLALFLICWRLKQLAVVSGCVCFASRWEALYRRREKLRFASDTDSEVTRYQRPAVVLRREWYLGLITAGASWAVWLVLRSQCERENSPPFENWRNGQALVRKYASDGSCLIFSLLSSPNRSLIFSLPGLPFDSFF